MWRRRLSSRVCRLRRLAEHVLFFLVRFVITEYFAVSDLSVFRDVFQFDEETCIGSLNVLNALEEASVFVAKSPRPKWL
jgi:hypothetical protein